MNNPDAIRAVVAKFFNVAEADVTDNFKFPAHRLSGSVGRTTLHAAIKRLAGVDLAAVWTADTFGELVGGHPTHSIKESAPPSQTSIKLKHQSKPPRDFAIGVDLEEASNLPSASDPWSDSFYSENFTPEEIAYAVRQSNPQLTLCGLWSAKESVIKLGGDYGGLKPKEIQVLHDNCGRPFIVVAGNSLTGTVDVSISHSNNFATAVSFKLLHQISSQVDAIPPSLTPVVDEHNPTKMTQFSLLNYITLFLAFSAFVFSIYSIVRLR